MQIVLLGEQASGKTTLYNRITKSQNETRYAGGSVTENVFSKCAAYGEVKFKILDTPGFGIYERKMAHAAAIIAALTEGSLNRILIVVKFERLERMRKAVEPVFAPISRYTELITLIITHWDLSVELDQEKDKINIQDNFRKHFNINSFIYTSITEDGDQTCQKILNEIKLSNPVQIHILETEYSNQFDLLDFNHDDEQLINESKAKLMNSFLRKTKTIKKYILNYQFNTSIGISQKQIIMAKLGIFGRNDLTQGELDFCEIVHELIQESRKLSKQCLKQFEKENFNLFNQLEQQYGGGQCYLLHVVLKKELYTEIAEVIDISTKFIRKIKGHCFKYIRKCNQCKQIWIKVQGCEGQTYCGAMPTKDELLESIGYQKWQIYWESEDKLLIVPTNHRNYNISFNSQLQSLNEQLNISKFGCGKPIQWDQMELLSHEELKQLVGPGMLHILCDQDEEISNESRKAFQPFKNQFEELIILQQRMIQYE